MLAAREYSNSLKYLAALCLQRATCTIHFPTSKAFFVQISLATSFLHSRKLPKLVHVAFQANFGFFFQFPFSVLTKKLTQRSLLRLKVNTLKQNKQLFRGFFTRVHYQCSSVFVWRRRQSCFLLDSVFSLSFTFSRRSKQKTSIFLTYAIYLTSFLYLFLLHQ